ncbi:unnamed protein product [Linum trigynum]|uniref:Uncharacterized protein n=1 Tax=Linum trigynum TaxID=586398 RepID=A0AAV2CK03_9ROSI
MQPKNTHLRRHHGLWRFASPSSKWERSIPFSLFSLSPRRSHRVVGITLLGSLSSKERRRDWNGFGSLAEKMQRERVRSEAGNRRKEGRAIEEAARVSSC